MLVLSTVMKQGEDKTSRMYYASSALTYLLAMVCSNMALQWVNYPTQVTIQYIRSYLFYVITYGCLVHHTGGWKVMQAHSRYDSRSFIWEQIISYGQILIYSHCSSWCGHVHVQRQACYCQARSWIRNGYWWNSFGNIFPLKLHFYGTWYIVLFISKCVDFVPYHGRTYGRHSGANEDWISVKVWPYDALHELVVCWILGFW